MMTQDGPPTGGRPATIKNNKVQAPIARAHAKAEDEPHVEGKFHAL